MTAPAPADVPAHPVLLFDGECALCSRTVRFILRFEREPSLRFAPIQSEPGREMLRRHGFDPDTVDTVVLVEPGGRVLTRSAVVVRLMTYLRRPWRWGRVVGVLPRGLLDAGYRVISRYRYHVFGKVDRCAIDERIRGRDLSMAEAGGEPALVTTP